MGLQKEQCVEWKRRHLRCCCNQVWMKNGGRIPRSVAAICKTFRISCLMENHPVRGGSEYKFDGPVIPFGAMVEYHPISAKDQSRLHQFGPKVLPGIFLGYVLYAGDSGKETLWSQTLKNWRRWTHQNFTPEGPMQRKCYTPMKGDNFKIPVADGTVKVPGGSRRLKPSTLIRDRPERRNEKFFEENKTNSLLRLHFEMTLHWMMRKLKMISGLLPEISFIAITWNPESNCTCREKNHFLFRWSTSTLPEQHIHHSM